MPKRGKPKKEVITKKVVTYRPVIALLRKEDYFAMRIVTFGDFKRVLEERLGPSASMLLYKLGLECGKRSGRRLAQRVPDKSKLLKIETEHKVRENWGELKFDLNMENGVGRVRLRNSFESKEHERSLHPTCDFFLGFMEGTLGEFFGRVLKLKEIRCVSQGYGFCEFEVERGD